MTTSKPKFEKGQNVIFNGRLARIVKLNTTVMNNTHKYAIRYTDKKGAATAVPFADERNISPI